MMTVFYKPMRRRRWMRIEAGQTPPTWKTFPMADKGVSGSAKSGRGGRRKRRRRAAGARALALSIRIWETTAPHVETWPLLLRSERLLPDPPLFGNPGRRERRRRAKLRRRREAAKYRREAREFLRAKPWCWRRENQWTRVVTLAKWLHEQERRTIPRPRPGPEH
jgi:hypothetical protein